MKKNLYFRTGLLVLLLFGAMLKAQAVTFYVSPSGSDTNPGTMAQPFKTIQHAINQLPSGNNTIVIAAGTYVEQLIITDKSVTLQGAGRATTFLLAPAIVPTVTTGNGSNINPIVYISGTSDPVPTVNIDGLTISGDGGRSQAAAADFFGVYYFAAGGSFTNNRITQIRRNPLDGSQTGLALTISHTWDATLTQNVTVSGNEIDDFQKQGISVGEPGTVVTMANNTVTASGLAVRGVIAQNNVVVGYGASATLTGNTISGSTYNTPAHLVNTFESAGVLAFDGTVTIGDGNVFSDNENAILVEDDGGFPYPASASYAGTNTFINNWTHISNSVAPSGGTLNFDRRVDNPAQPGNVFGSLGYAVYYAAAGNTLNASAGTFSELITLDKALTLNGAGTSSVVTYTSAVPSGELRSLFKVTAANVTIKNFKFEVDLGLLHSAIHTSGSDRDNLTIQNNTIQAKGTAAGTYGWRNAIAINPNILGIPGYTLDSDGFGGVVVQGNTVTNTGGTYFRAAVQMDLCGGTIGGDSPAEGNTFTSINHDVNVRFCNQGNVTIKNNTCLGGGIQAAEFNAGAGTIVIANNSLSGAVMQPSSGALGTGALLRLQNNQVDKVVTVSNNTFTDFRWAASVENFRNVTFSGNTFTPKSGATDYRHISFNTKLIASTSATITMTTVGATLTNNTFNGSGASGGTGLAFFNHRNDSSIGTYTLGTPGNENTFGAGMSQFIRLDNSTGPSSGFSSPFNDYASAPSTTMGPWAANLDAYHNKFDVGTGAKTPSSMNLTERTALEAALFHKPDDASVGLISYFYPVRNVTQNTLSATIGAAIAAANAGDVIELKEWTFNERVVIDKSLTLQGVDRYKTILDGTGLSGEGSGITINNGVTNVTIKKLTVKNFIGVSPNQSAGIYAALSNHNLTIEEVSLLDNLGGSGFYANGPVNHVSVTKSRASGHVNYLSKGVARGMVIWNGLKSNITFSQDTVTNNGCCGIELQDGSASGVTITGNWVKDNADNGIGLVGLTGGSGANLISGNTLENNGRFGLEIKNPNGNGATSGDGSIVIENNTVTRSGSLADTRDWAGIAVFRRSVLSGNADFPKGVVVQNNTVTGATQPSNAESFGIVIEGVGNKVLNNTVSGWEVGIQEQASTGRNHPGDADQTGPENDNYFSRGNAQIACSNTVTGNSYSGNGTNFRQQGNIVNLTATASNTGPYYPGSTIELSAATTTPNRTLTSFAWTGPDGYSQTVTSNPATRANAVASFAGTYNVTVTDQDGCQATASTNVVVCTGTVTIAGGGQVCTNQTATVTFSFTGTAPYTLVYSGPSGNVTVNNISASPYTIQAGVGTYGVVSVTDANGCVATTNQTVNVGAQSPVAITGITPSQQICAGADFVLSVQTTGPVSGYQWFRNNQPVAGATGPTLTVNLTAISSFYVVVTGPCNQVTSQTVTLTFKQPTTLRLTSLVSQVCEGGNLTLSVAGSGPGTLQYAWRKDSPTGPVIGTGSTFTIQNAQVADAGTYYATVQGDCPGPTVSVNVTVRYVRITSQPQSVNLCSGQTTLSVGVQAVGVTPTYQWRRNGTAIAGATASTLTVQANRPGTYTVEVRSACGNLTSEGAVVGCGNNRLSAEEPAVVISPNPATGTEIRCRVTGLEQPEFSLFNGAGRSLGLKAQAGETPGTWVLKTVQRLPSGVYVLQASEGQLRLNQRVVVTE